MTQHPDDPLLWIVCHQTINTRYAAPVRSCMPQMRCDAERQAWASNRSDRANVYWIEPFIEQLAFTSR